MKKTLRLIALAGILAASWLPTEKPGYAISPCSEVQGQSCDICCARCLTDAGLVRVCTCENNAYNCGV